MMRWLILIVFVACGSRNDNPPPAGTEGGPCYGNGTCNADLVCTSGLCVSPDLCAEVDCSGHGTCVMNGGRPSCECDVDYQPVGLTCVAGCPPDGCTECPDDMVLVTAQDVCIDRYEATVFENSDCTGARYGAGWDNFPAAFPDLAASPGCEGTCVSNSVVEPTLDLYACSVAGIEPTSYITWYQARRACHSAGKRLCTTTEWTSACEGPSSFDYPYGDSWVSSACNGGDEGNQSPVPTGQYGTCEGGYPGLFDMSGNLNEWLENGTNNRRHLGGGDFESYNWDSPLMCVQALWEDNAPSIGNEYKGFRCCK